MYKFNPKEKKIISISKQIDLPNGLGFSQDEKYLYVNKMGIPFSRSNSRILKINLDNLETETFFEGRELFEKFKDGRDFDGMAIHSSGNILTSGPRGLLIFSPDGQLKARIDFSHIINCTFDYYEKYLYATWYINNTRVYRIKLKE